MARRLRPRYERGMRAWLVVTIVLVAACGPKKGPGSGGSGGGSGSASDGGGDAASGSDTGSGGGTVTPAPLTRAECEKMIDHVLAVGMDEQREQKKAEYVPTDEQVAEIRAKMVEQQLPQCLEWPRPVWECTMAATSVASLYACAEGGG